jgi:hypothetical protein
MVAEEGAAIEEAKRHDPHGKGGGLVDGGLAREFPEPRKAVRRDAA